MSANGLLNTKWDMRRGVPAAVLRASSGMGAADVASVAKDLAGKVVSVQTGTTYLENVKKVSAVKEVKNYPQDTDARAALASGRVDAWVTDRFVALNSLKANPGLGLKMGDALLLGDAQLKVGRIIVVEPDRGAGFMSFAPRVMLNVADLPATRLIQPASRVTYRLAVASRSNDDAPVRSFVQWAEAEIKALDVDPTEITKELETLAFDTIVSRMRALSSFPRRYDASAVKPLPSVASPPTDNAVPK